MKIKKFSRILVWSVLFSFVLTIIAMAEPESQSPAESSVEEEVQTEKDTLPVTEQEELETSISEEPEATAATEALEAQGPVYLTITGRSFRIIDPNEAGRAIPEYFSDCEAMIDDRIVPAWREAGARSADLVIFFGVFDGSDAQHFYTYDTKEKTLQRYFSEEEVYFEQAAEGAEPVMILNPQPEIEPEPESETEPESEKIPEETEPEVVFGKKGKEGFVPIRFYPESNAKSAKIILEKNDNDSWRVEKTVCYSGVFEEILPYIITALIEIVVFVGTLFLIKKLDL